ncbi:polyprenyl synthetase family protein [Carnobacterium maltaromaticum]|uniref:polyprenyl synthetase family protein n=1 Tax=Carnobacterium maltaromaticum TaxID=2751 RepID=UPI00295E2963|nr:polyprenyl synthetase family protein [Carnobacterium maltaromaticum]
MKFDKAVENISPIIQERYINFINSLEFDMDSNLYFIYREYTGGDKYLPRPLLTFFGYLKDSNISKDTIYETMEELGDLILVPQVLRDVLAIHDDIVDEDLVKFSKPTLPTSYSYIAEKNDGDTNLEMLKSGKDLALFFADYLYSVLTNIVINSTVDNQIKIDTIKLINNTNIRTQQGQIKELLLQNTSVKDIKKDFIIELYRDKAACYCYSFPFELGLTIGRATDNLKKKSRDVLLKIGVASQIIDDITGTFPGLLDHDKDSLGELINLRRTLLLVTLIENVDENNLINRIVRQNKCTEEEALYIKESMINSKVVEDSIETVNQLVSDLPNEIKSLNFEKDTEEYLLDLLQSRVLTNLNILKERVE